MGTDEQQVADGATRHGARRTWLVVLASAAVLATTVGVTAALSSSDSVPGTAPGTAPRVQSHDAPVPEGTRLVGLRHAAIAVPDEWGTNRTHCGVPQKDTVVIDVGAVPACLTGRPSGVESVEIWEGEPRFDFEVDRTVEIDGVTAQVQRTTCARDVRGEVCNGTVYFPSLEVGFRAESSTDADEVDRSLGWIRIVPERVGVPGFQMIAIDHQERAGEKYAEALRGLGLAVEVRTRKIPAAPPGYVLDATPGPGTMVEPGSVITITVVAEPEGPAEEVSVGMNSVDASDEYHALKDAQIRAGATIELSVGDRIWAYAHGKRASTLAGELAGTSLEVHDWEEGPNYPHSWVAVSPGTTRVTLTIVADGEPVVLGVVTVAVD